MWFRPLCWGDWDSLHSGRPMDRRERGAVQWTRKIIHTADVGQGSMRYCTHATGAGHLPISDLAASSFCSKLMFCAGDETCWTILVPRKSAHAADTDGKVHSCWTWRAAAMHIATNQTSVILCARPGTVSVTTSVLLPKKLSRISRSVQ